MEDFNLTSKFISSFSSDDQPKARKKEFVLAIVDDDPVLHHIIRTMIFKYSSNCKIIGFYDGQEVLNYVSQDEVEFVPDVIILDLYMPVLDGWAFLDGFNRLKNRFDKEIKIVILTCSIDPADIAMSINCFKMIHKPISYSDILDLLGPEFERNGRLN